MKFLEECWSLWWHWELHLLSYRPSFSLHSETLFLSFFFESFLFVCLLYLLHTLSFVYIPFLSLLDSMSVFPYLYFVCFNRNIQCWFFSSCSAGKKTYNGFFKNPKLQKTAKKVVLKSYCIIFDRFNISYKLVNAAYVCYKQVLFPVPTFMRK